MNNLVIDIYKQALAVAYQAIDKNSAAPTTHTFQAIAAGTFAEMLINECVNLREEVELVGVHSIDYEEGIWAGLQLYQDQIKKHFTIE